MELPILLGHGFSHAVSACVLTRLQPLMAHFSGCWVAHPRLLRVGLFLRFFSGVLPPILTPVIPNEREESASALSLIAASSYPACEEREEPRGASRHLAFFLPSRLPRLVLLLPGAVNGLPKIS